MFNSLKNCQRISKVAAVFFIPTMRCSTEWKGTSVKCGCLWMVWSHSEVWRPQGGNPGGRVHVLPEGLLEVTQGAPKLGDLYCNLPGCCGGRVLIRAGPCDWQGPSCGLDRAVYRRGLPQAC